MITTNILKMTHIPKYNEFWNLVLAKQGNKILCILYSSIGAYDDTGFNCV